MRQGWTEGGAEAGRRGHLGDTGLSMLVTVISLLVTALLVVIVLKATAGSPAASSSGTSSPVAQADAVQAQQNLDTGLTTARTEEATGQAVVDPSMLQSANPSITFTTSPSTGPGTVSVDSAVGGPVTMAAGSSGHVCWEVWSSTAGGTWFGMRTGQSSCPAPDPSTSPSSVLPTSGVTWRQGSFPTA